MTPEQKKELERYIVEGLFFLVTHSTINLCTIMIKVEHTKTHKITQHYSYYETHSVEPSVLVTDAELVLVKCEVKESDKQLSGLGFSSTQRNSIVVKVKGKFDRMLKVNF